MNGLVAVSYPNAIAADNALQHLLDLQQQQLIGLDDAVLVERRGDGVVKLHQTRSHTGSGAAGGAVAGGLIGLLFLAPFLGAAIGAGAGAVGGASVDDGLADDFLKRLGARLGPGNVALVLLVRHADTDAVLTTLHGQYDGEILHTSLPAAAEATLRAAVTAARRG